MCTRITMTLQNGPGETKLNLSRLTNVVKDKPVLVLAVNQMGQLSARAAVPPSCPGSASDWLSTSLKDLEGAEESVGCPRGQDPRQVANLKPLDVAEDAVRDIMDRAVEVGNSYARDNF